MEEAGRAEIWTEYRGRELEWIRDILGRKTSGGRLGYHAAQRAIVNSLFRDRFVHIRAGRKCSKSFTLADAALAALYTRTCVVLGIMPTWMQVARKMFGDIRDAVNQSMTTLPGRHLTTRIDMGPKHYMVGLSTNRPENVQGWHPGVVVPEDPDANITPDEALKLVEVAKEDAGSGELFIFIDEAPGVDRRIFEALEGSLQGPNVYLWLSGNPQIDSNADHPFAVEGQPGSRCHRIKISHRSEELYPDPVQADEVFDRGYGPDGDLTYGLPAWIADWDWVDSRIKVHGEDSSWVKAMILGQYAGMDEANRVIPLSLLVASEGRGGDVGLGPSIGIDLSGGGDRCVAVLLVDGVVRAITEQKVKREDPRSHMTTAEWVVGIARQWGRELQAAQEWSRSKIPADRIHVDRGAMGDAICSRLDQIGWPVDRVDFGGKPRRGDWPELVDPRDVDTENQRAYMHWVLRRGLEEGMFSVPREFKEVWDECQWPEFTQEYVGSRTVVKITRKKDIKKEFGRSPDYLDALLLATCQPARARAGFA